MASSENPLEHPRTTICGVRFSCFDREGAADWILGAARSGAGGYVCVTGAHGVVSANDDERFRSILNGASMNTLDGQPVVWIARMRGYAVDRVTGRELVWDVVDKDAACEITHVLFGATPAVTDKMVERLRKRNPSVRVIVYNPPFGEISDEELDRVCARLSANGPMIVWVGLSTPRQESLAVRLSRRLPNAPAVAIGAGFDFVAGLKPVAPRIVTTLSLEWLFRMASEPRRLLPRYLDVIPRFLALLCREIAAGTLLTGVKAT